jgi:hypothetical protein
MADSSSAPARGSAASADVALTADAISEADSMDARDSIVAVAETSIVADQSNAAQAAATSEAQLAVTSAAAEAAVYAAVQVAAVSAAEAEVVSTAEAAPLTVVEADTAADTAKYRPQSETRTAGRIICRPFLFATQSHVLMASGEINMVIRYESFCPGTHIRARRAAQSSRQEVSAGSLVFSVLPAAQN